MRQNDISSDYCAQEMRKIGEKKEEDAGLKESERTEEDQVAVILFVVHRHQHQRSPLSVCFPFPRIVEAACYCYSSTTLSSASTFTILIPR